MPYVILKNASRFILFEFNFFSNLIKESISTNLEENGSRFDVRCSKFKVGIEFS